MNNRLFSDITKPRLSTHRARNIWGAWSILLLSFLPSTLTYGEETLIVAHRGASKDTPENTIPAFQLAWKQGADAIEGDFHLTQDGKIVCIHDGNTKKVAGKNLVVRESTLSDLQQLDVGAYRGKDFVGTRVPTIAEVFATVPEQKLIYVEIKCGPEIIPVLLDELQKSNLCNKQIIVISFKKEVIQELKAKAPQYKAYWLSGMKKDQSGNFRPSLETVLATLEAINADGFSSNQNVIDESYIESVIRNGYEYHVWTIDNVKTARRFKKWGAHSITTNVPGLIRKQLAEE